ncbi:MAG: hypothetical protein MUC59_12870 [Saprospiraceae bacterium]|nr:hypothetical protein [Saprospiraceae bacterium]
MSDTPYEILGTDNLLRRIPLKPSHIFQGRITSACFKTKPSEDGLSVDIEGLTEGIYSVYNQDTHTLARPVHNHPAPSCRHRHARQDAIAFSGAGRGAAPATGSGA